jgi:ATP-dependent DNA helicase RecG
MPNRHSTDAIWAHLSADLRRFIRRRVSDEHAADDLLQETFVRVHRNLSAVQETDRLAAWVYRIARNVIHDHHRATTNLAPLTDDPVAEADGEACVPCAAGRQGYVIYPVIDESEKADLKAATTGAERLGNELKDVVVGLVHGRMKAEEREVTMRGFRDGAVQLLVATTVIEVGIDVPNATVMLIEHAERFGLAQLHQLRGRVGRGAEASHCILLSSAGPAAGRLRAFADTTDGFAIAELDLRERGMGELTGARQSGGLALRFADLTTDVPLLEAARREAAAIIERDPGLAQAAHAVYRERVVQRYERGFELFRVG